VQLPVSSRLSNPIDSFTFFMESISDSHSLPYHVLLIFLVDDKGYLGGAYHIKPMGFTGGVSARSFDELQTQCYESLDVGIEMMGNAPFDITDTHKSVVFDFVECLNEDEYDLADGMDAAGDTFENISEAVQRYV
jgi:hypothetical protein